MLSCSQFGGPDKDVHEADQFQTDESGNLIVFHAT